MNLNDTSAAVRGEKIDLTKNEFLILKTLMEKQGKVVSREEIMERLWGNDEFVDDNTLTVNITRIRKKLEAAGVNDFITTKRGLGYLVEHNVEIFVAGSKKIIESLFLLAKIQELDNEQKHADEKKPGKISHRKFCQKI